MPTSKPKLDSAVYKVSLPAPSHSRACSTLVLDVQGQPPSRRPWHKRDTVFLLSPWHQG